MSKLRMWAKSETKKLSSGEVPPYIIDINSGGTYKIDYHIQEEVTKLFGYEICKKCEKEIPYDPWNLVHTHRLAEDSYTDNYTFCSKDCLIKFLQENK